MGKLFTGLLLIAIVATGWFLLKPSDKIDFVVTIDQEVTQLENELSELDAAVAAGTLSPEQATEAKVKIINHLDKINTSANSASANKQLTSIQQNQLTDGLNRLKNILIDYQTTLITIDKTAIDNVVKTKLASGRINKSIVLTTIAVETINNVEDTASEVIEDYKPNTELDTQLEEATEPQSEGTDELGAEATSTDSGEILDSTESTSTDETSTTEVTDETATETEVSTQADETEIVQ
jgi:hypothetical protein